MRRKTYFFFILLRKFFGLRILITFFSLSFVLTSFSTVVYAGDTPCPTFDIRYECAPASEMDCSSLNTEYSTGWFRVFDVADCSYEGSPPTFSACCFNANGMCTDYGYDCAFECAGADNPHEIIHDNLLCPTGQICCENPVESCECKDEGGTCYLSDPSSGDVVYNLLPFSCEGCNPGDCYILGEEAEHPSSCGTLGLHCCSEPYELCYEGTPYITDPWKICQCMGSDYDPGDPVEMVYTGPVITTLQAILSPLAGILYYGGLFIGVSFIIYSGYRLMVSQGDPRTTKDAQEQLTAAILGVLFILLSAAILRVIIGYVFGETINI